MITPQVGLDIRCLSERVFNILNTCQSNNETMQASLRRVAGHIVRDFINNSPAIANELRKESKSVYGKYADFQAYERVWAARKHTRSEFLDWITMQDELAHYIVEQLKEYANTDTKREE